MSETARTLTFPSEEDARAARQAAEVLVSHRSKANQPLHVKVLGGHQRQTVELPAAASQLVLRILDEMSRGNAVTLVPVQPELTTQQAADLLNVSRPYLIQLLEEGKIEFRKVGRHRRVRFTSLMSFKRRQDAARLATLEELAAYDQELGL